MRLLGILSITLLFLAGINFGYERRFEITDRMTGIFEGFLLDERSVVDAAPLGLATQHLDEGLAIIAMREAGSLNTLVGFPDFARARFELPQTVKARSGELILEIAGDLSDDADGVLRISVNGMRRTAVLLNEGALHRKIILPLNTRELSSNALNVAFSMEGHTGDTLSCGPGGAVLQVLPSSHLSLQLQEPVTDPQDKLLLAGVPAKFAWPTNGLQDQAIVLATALEVTQSRSDVLLGNAETGGNALQLADIKALSGTLPAAPALAQSDATDLSAALGQRRTQTFAHETRWRMAFDTDTLSGQPQAVDLGLTFGSAEPGDTSWLMSVYLNDRLLHTQRATGDTGNLAQTLNLPQSFLRRSNVLTVAFQSGFAAVGSCPAGTPSVAELNTAKLVTVDTAEPTPLVDLAALLQGGANLQVHAPLDVFDGQLALDALAGLSELGLALDVQASRVSAAGVADITVVHKQDLQGVLAAQAGGRTDGLWLAYQPRDGDEKIETQPVTADTMDALDDLPALVLVIAAAGQGNNL